MRLSFSSHLRVCEIVIVIVVDLRGLTTDNNIIFVSVFMLPLFYNALNCEIVLGVVASAPVDISENIYWMSTEQYTYIFSKTV